ncbi:MAG: NUDIX domain-containing protein [Lachnospiraceae bacterium]|nr:NUDIX domain-containing protein [Lachnospiraceae bacterium]MBQ5916179.1 NUDIX domain-containing protein [Lachnospiraceae bacterium]
MKVRLSTLCYIEKDNQYLMLHRVVKKNDVNKDKWIGVGGHFEEGESPEECVLREVKEETGYTLTSYRYRGLVTFVFADIEMEYMSLFTADGFEGEPIPCNEGVLEWVDIEKVWKLNLWEGDKIFFRLLDENVPFFSLKLVYSKEGKLEYAALNGKTMEMFDVIDEEGKSIGLIKERGVVHREGALHATSHIWIARPNALSGYDVLLQKRSLDKDSHPGCYDISSAGHIVAGDGPLDSAIRELEEELGIMAKPEELLEFGVQYKNYEGEFYGKPFRDNQRSILYLYKEPLDIDTLRLQASEIESVIWMDYREALQAICENSIKHCIYEEEFRKLGKVLGIES